MLVPFLNVSNIPHDQADQWSPHHSPDVKCCDNVFQWDWQIVNKICDLR